MRTLFSYDASGLANIETALSTDRLSSYMVANDAALTLRGLNLGNEASAPIFGYPAPGRRLYVELAKH